MKPNKTILVTGANGFIGSHMLSYLLGKGYSAFGLMREGKDHSCPYKKNILTYTNTEPYLSCLQDKRFDIVVHLAGFHGKKNTLESFYDNMHSNVFFGVKILQSLKTKPALFINANSYSSFINKTLNSPDGFYGASKESFSLFLKDFSHRYNMGVLNCYLYNTYGLKDTRDKVIDIYIHTALTGREIQTKAGEVEIAFIYISDLVESLEKSFTLSRRSLFENYCVYGDEIVKLKTIRKEIENLTGKEIRVEKFLPEDEDTLTFDPLYPLLPTMVQKVSLKEGLSYLIQKARENKV